jgi:hypothetical protein
MAVTDSAEPTFVSIHAGLHWRTAESFKRWLSTPVLGLPRIGLVRIIGWVSQRPQFPLHHRLGHREGMPPLGIDMASLIEPQELLLEALSTV